MANDYYLPDGDQQQFMSETQYEEYMMEQEALPPHKRDGYAEKMADLADMEMDRIREAGLLRAKTVECLNWRCAGRTGC